MSREVEFYHQVDGSLICDLCPHRCKFKKQEIGICRQRQRAGENLIALNYAEAASIAVDPIEKKPLYHFHPGSVILSIGANGCNLKCQFCQNCEISQGSVPTRPLSISELVKLAGTHGSIGVAFTYSEPLMWYEYVLDASSELRRGGFVNVLVTNGFIEEAPLAKLLPTIDAMNIDIKSLNDEFYRKICKGRLDPVLRSIRQAHQAGVHIELTHLVVTGWNDNEKSISELVSWIAGVSDHIPLHLSRYFPRYQYDEPATSEAFLLRALEMARQELKFVYLGNIAGGEGSSTFCPNCGALLVERSGYNVKLANLKKNRCGKCDLHLPFV
ncbi:MAG: AmmeMemoRadiSam system radical SAM enzyme [bacterium]|nr:AmmeMemoRadiSam system radical SAM enzyme [bacterium]